MKTAVVTLGGVNYELRPLPLRPARALREKISGEISGLGQALRALEGLEITRLDDLGGLIQQLGGTLAGSLDIIADWLFEFSPELQADRERILDEAFDEEILQAFGEALKMLYPFGETLNGLSGLLDQATSTSLPSANGVSGQTKSMRRR